MLTHAGLRDIRGLPGYFLFTSTEALGLAKDAPVATDANLLIEIRLAGLTGPIAGNESPYSLLQQYVKTDFRAYLAEDQAGAGQQAVPDNNSTGEVAGVPPRPYRRIH